MRILDKYISRTVLNATVVIFLIFFGLRLFVGIFGELGALGEGHYNIVAALKYVVLTMPLNIYQLYPSITLLGVLAGLGILASSNELTVVRVSGVSLLRIFWVVMKVMLLLTILITLMGELIAPKLDNYAEKEKAFAERSGVMGDDGQTSIWLREDNSFINIGRSLPGGNSLQDITRFTFNDNYQLISTSFAKHAEHMDKKWEFYDIRRTDFYPDHVVTTTIAQQEWPLTFKPHLVIAADPDQMTLDHLLQQAKYSRSNGLDATDYQLAFWMRVLQPLATLVMVFLAIPFIFGPLRSSTMGLRILSGVMVGLSFYIINRFFAPFSVVYQIPAAIAATIPIVLFFIIGLVLMLRRKT